MNQSTKITLITIFVSMAIGFCIGFFGFDKDDSIEQKMLRDKITSQTQRLIIMSKARNQDKLKIKHFEDEKIKSDSTISNYTDNQTDSFFANFHRQY